MSEDLDRVRESIVQIERDVNRIKNETEIRDLLRETLKEIKQINNFTSTMLYFLWGGAGGFAIHAIYDFLR